MLNRARDWWERLGRNNQIIFAASLIGALVALIGFVAWASTPEYMPLFSNLSAQDENAVADKLKELNIPYRTTQNATSIEVPAQMHDEAVMKLASANLPASNTATLQNGDDVFANSHITDTDSMEAARMRRALEQRVSHTIATMEPIASATVQYAAADNNPLVMSNHDASASVLVTCKPGRQLTDENVRSIVRVVQMSYTGLLDKNITLVDSRGDLLWDGLHTGGGGLEDDALHKQEREIAMQRRTDLQAALDRTLGPHKSIVLTQVELDPNETKEHQVESLPGAVIDKSTQTEKLTGQGTVRGAAVGAAGNVNGAPTAPGAPGIPTYPGATGGSPDSNYSNEITHTTSQPGSITKDQTSSPGQIKRLTVSVLLDKSKIPVADLTATIATIKQTVETDISADPNDPTHARVVSVSAINFDHTEENAEAKASADATSADNMRRMAEVLVPFSIMVIALIILARALRRPGSTTAQGQLALAGEGGMGGPLMLSSDGSPLAGRMVSEVTNGNPIGLSQGASAPHTFEVIEEAFDANLESIVHLTKSKPEMVAMLIKSWLSDEGK